METLSVIWCFLVFVHFSSQTVYVDMLTAIMIHFYNDFYDCVKSSLRNNRFYLDNITDYIASSSNSSQSSSDIALLDDQTVANLLTTTEYKRQLAKDEDYMRNSFIAKMFFCKNVALDEDMMDIYIYDSN